MSLGGAVSTLMYIKEFSFIMLYFSQHHDISLYTVTGRYLVL